MTAHNGAGDRLPEGCAAPGCDRPPRTMDGVHGRRCEQHPPTYSRQFALAAVGRGDVGLACAHLRAHLAFRARGAA